MSHSTIDASKRCLSASVREHQRHGTHQTHVSTECCRQDLDLTVNGRHNMLVDGLSNRFKKQITRQAHPTANEHSLWLEDMDQIDKPEADIKTGLRKNLPRELISGSGSFRD